MVKLYVYLPNRVILNSDQKIHSLIRRTVDVVLAMRILELNYVELVHVHFDE